MSNTHKRNILLGAFIILWIISASCRLATHDRQATPTPRPVPVTTESVEQLIENVQKAAETALMGGDIQLVITEQQLTSLAALELEDTQDFQVEELQIHLHPGQIQITGQATYGNTSLPINIVLSISVDASGNIETSVISAKLGFLTLPLAVTDQLTDQFNQIITSLSNSSSPIKIHDIVISEGYMTITGSAR